MQSKCLSWDYGLRVIAGLFFLALVEMAYAHLGLSPFNQLPNGKVTTNLMPSMYTWIIWVIVVVVNCIQRNRLRKMRKEEDSDSK